MAKKIIKARMQQRTDTLANWASENPVLLKGEFGLVSDDPNAYKVGDGVTAWNDLPMRGWGGNITQTTGESTTDVMSQKAVSENLDSLGQLITNVSTQTNRLELTKANAVPGKGLSTNDFTDAEQHKLASLQNYDDTKLRTELIELSAEVSEINQQINNLPQGASMTPITYADLVALRNKGELVAGSYYRITDYITTTAQTNTCSAMHPFDVIVLALSEDTLAEEAYAIQREFNIEDYKDAYSHSWAERMVYLDTYDYNGKTYHRYESESQDLQMLVDFDNLGEVWTDVGTNINYTYSFWPAYAKGNDDEEWQDGKNYAECITFKTYPNYFANSNLAAWKIWYNLDNDTERFAWADTENGKGVIYRMIDEWNNDVPYDFKNIQQEKKKGFTYTQGGNTYNFVRAESLDTVVEGVRFYGYVSDTTPNAWYENKCWVTDAAPTITSELYNGDGSIISYGGSIISINLEYSKNYVFAEAGDLYGSSSGNQIKPHLDRGVQKLNNISFGMSCCNNNFGCNCYNNTFGDNCRNNSLGNMCSYNIFGNDFCNNILGNECGNNSFDYACSTNTLGNSCSYNVFGNNCVSNTFRCQCSYNTFGGSCSSNSFGNDCNSNSFGNGCSNNSFGNDCNDTTSLDVDGKLSPINKFKFLGDCNGLTIRNPTSSLSSAPSNIIVMQGCSGEINLAGAVLKIVFLDKDGKIGSRVLYDIFG